MLNIENVMQEVRIADTERDTPTSVNGLSVAPLQTLLEVIAGQWTLYMVWTLLKNEKLRFGELRREVPGISSKVLTERLRMLEREGFVYRHYQTSVPPHVTYEPTNRLRELGPVVCGFEEIAERWYAKNGAGVTN